MCEVSTVNMLQYYQRRVDSETDFFPVSSGSMPSNMAASPVAPAPSTIAFSSSTRRRMARAMYSSLNMTEKYMIAKNHPQKSFES